LLGVGGMDIEDVDGRAFARKDPRNRRADSARASGDHGGFSGKFQFEAPLFQLEVYFVASDGVKVIAFT
jgi:hypothetical protein